MTDDKLGYEKRSVGQSHSIKDYPSTNFCFRAQKISDLTSAFQQSELAHQFLVMRVDNLPYLVARDSGGGFAFEC